MTIQNQAFELINQIKKKLSDTGIECGITEKRQYNFEFTAREFSEKIKVQVYFGKKGVKTVLQGNSDLEIHSKIESILNGGKVNSGKDKNLAEPDEYLGSDETGKGDFFGPLTVAAVYLNKDLSDKLKKIGVCDSKDLNDNQINLMAEEIKGIIGNKFKVIIVEPEVYNEVYVKFNNLNKMLDSLHFQVLDPLLEKFKCKNVIVDKFSKSELEIVKKWGSESVEFEIVTKAERYTAVAAASILARAAFNSWFEKNRDEEGDELPKGASLNVEKFASVKKKIFGLKYFENKAKLHFKTINKI